MLTRSSQRISNPMRYTGFKLGPENYQRDKMSDGIRLRKYITG